jgi:hypothetical protein
VAVATPGFAELIAESAKRVNREIAPAGFGGHPEIVVRKRGIEQEIRPKRSRPADASAKAGHSGGRPPGLVDPTGTASGSPPSISASVARRSAPFDKRPVELGESGGLALRLEHFRLTC